MLATYFKKLQTQERYRSGPAGPYFDEFIAWLEARGHQPRPIRRLLRGAHRFSLWTQIGRGASWELDAQALEAFRRALQTQQRLRYPNGNYSDLFLGARHFVTFLEASGHLPPPARCPAVPAPQLLVDFRAWMQTHRGTTTATLNNYQRPLLDLLTTLGEDPAQYTAHALRAFILDRARRHGIGHAKMVVTTARTFLRFLIAVGHCPPGLEEAIPTIARWRFASLPRYLSAEAIEGMLASCDLATRIGLRDRAVLLLLARLGLRAGEVAAVRLRDINWQAGTVQVAGKNRRQTRLPLPQEVGDAILAYLEHRPMGHTDSVFLTTCAPLKGLTRQAVSGIATRAMQRADIEAPVHGAHVLRHSAATQMLRHDVPVPVIGAVLRHASMETTAGYAKVDLPLLQHVVQPWPEVKVC